MLLTLIYAMSTRQVKPVHEILIFMAYSQNYPLNLLLQVSSGSRALNFGLSLHLNLYFLCESREGSDESAHCSDSSEP